MVKYNYLNDKAFLKKIDLENYKEQFIKIEILNFNTEELIASIEGKATGGSCNFSGTSNMRRTASCSLIVDRQGIHINGYDKPSQYYNILEVENLISMNKKVRIETGFTNSFSDLGLYTDYDIIWFPLGTYVIKNANVSKNNSGINISLTLNDKCALLNGDMGGTIPAATVFSESELYNATGTQREVQKLLIKDVIKYLVVDFGGERPENVIITDIPDDILKVVKWSGQEPVYLIETKTKKRLTTTEPLKGSEYKTFNYGENIGYMLEPFVYPGVLECNAGDTVAALLDKIKNTLGNFEWFYDIWGRFHFQEKRNYINVKPSETTWQQLTEKDYFNFSTPSLSEYVFDNQSIVTSIVNNPQFQNIKNDYIVWGATKTVTGADKPIRYHLAFQQKPSIREEKMLAFVYTDYRGLQQVVPMIENQTYRKRKPDKNSDRNFYYWDNNNKLWHWDDTLDEPNFRQLIERDGELCYLLPNDWRTELYFQGLEANDKTFSKNYYAAELNAEWPKIYDVKRNPQEQSENGLKVYIGDYKNDLDQSNYEYWLDFLEGSEGISQSISPFTVDNIGRRTKVITDTSSNCIFPVNTPNYVYVIADGDVQEEVQKITNKGYEVIQIGEETASKVTLGGSQNSAYDKVKELLYIHTSYNESINLSVIPIYYLEPNTRITVFDEETAINGDYIINTISLPLTYNGTSTITAVKVVEKTY